MFTSCTLLTYVSQNGSRISYLNCLYKSLLKKKATITCFVMVAFAAHPYAGNWEEGSCTKRTWEWQ